MRSFQLLTIRNQPLWALTKGKESLKLTTDKWVTRIVALLAVLMKILYFQANRGAI